MNSERHQRLMDILADAMECDTDQRAPLLAEACAGDEALRQDVERLLIASREALHFMEDSIVDSVLSARGDPDDNVVGNSVGPYLVTAEIGRGGMGAVYLGVRNDDAYRRQVAIKVVKRGMDTDVIVRRFRHERQILASLDHQNIARLFDGGTTADGRPYLVMEYVEGQPIQRYATDHALSVRERLELFLTVCDAVQYAHRRQVIHRDLKPGNILVTSEGVPKLLDFGIARVLYPNAVNITTETTLPRPPGMTPEYASPEQMRGETPTAANDVYSLGVLLYELLTGRRPFELKCASPYEIVRAVDAAPPEKPSAIVSRNERQNGAAAGKSDDFEQARRNAASVEFEKLRRSLSGDLDTIVLMALRKEPERRYPSVAQLAEDIRRHLAGLPIIARKDAAAYRAARYFKRNRAFVVTTAAVALLCIVLGIVLSRTLSGARAPATGSSQTRDVKRGPHDDEAYRLYLRGTYFWNQRNAESFVKAIEYFEQAIERDPNYALAYDGLAKSYGLLGAYIIPSDEPFPKAKTAALKALELDPNLAEAHTSLALVYWLHDWDWAAADREFRRAIELDARYITAHHWYGLYLGEMGRADESIAELTRALELDPVSVPVNADLGRVYFWARRYDEALQQYQRAHEMGPTIGAFWTEIRYVYEQKKMYAEWFSLLNTQSEVNDSNRDAYLKKDWKEFVWINCRQGGSHDGAEYCARAGDKDTAFAQLEQAYKLRDHRLSQLRVNPIWDPVRDDPRFAELLRRMNL